MRSLGLAVGVVAVGVRAILTRGRGKRRPDLGTISDAWLHDARSYDHEIE
jgi:hypothetical protein